MRHAKKKEPPTTIRGAIFQGWWTVTTWFLAISGAFSIGAAVGKKLAGLDG